MQCVVVIAVLIEIWSECHFQSLGVKFPGVYWISNPMIHMLLNVLFTILTHKLAIFLSYKFFGWGYDVTASLLIIAICIPDKEAKTTKRCKNCLNIVVLCQTNLTQYLNMQSRMLNWSFIQIFCSRSGLVYSDRMGGRRGQQHNWWRRKTDLHSINLSE